jgi:thiol-disulfide isomerase/thioredoxin
MITPSLAAVLQLSILATGAETYAEAHQATSETGKPMVVMVGADWCAACKSMERDVLPEVRRRGLFRRVSFAKVDLDKQQRLGQKLTQGGPIPQLIMYRKTRRGWFRRRLIGRQSYTTVKAFVDEGLRLDAEDENKSTRTSDSEKEDRET